MNVPNTQPTGPARLIPGLALFKSLITVLYHISQPHDALLDKFDASRGTTYRSVADKESAMTEPGLIVWGK